MKKLFTLAAIFCCLLGACNQPDKKIVQHQLNPANVPSVFIDIDITKDTTVVLAGGTQLIIPKGAIKSSKNTVKLEVKEVLTPKQIIVAGMLTMADGKLLSSGGMLYVNAAKGEDAGIVQAITAKIPTPEANPNMSVFKGDTSSSTINWTDPQPLASVQQSQVYETGKELYENCASCHHLYKDATGPGLYGSLQHWESKEKCYAFIHNSAKMIASGDEYSNCLFDTWGKTVMPPFPNLTGEQLDKIYQYIDEESKKQLGADTVKYLRQSYEECKKRQAIVDKLYEEKMKLEPKRKLFVTVKNTPRPDDRYKIPGPGDVVDRVVPDMQYADYYAIQINTFGWYNVDIKAGDMSGYKDSKLSVKLAGSRSSKVRVMLFIPSSRMLAEGGLLSDGMSYGFYETNGSIVLPHGATAYVLAMSEEQDREQLYYGSTSFTIKQQQDLVVTLAPATRENMLAAINALNFQDVQTDIQKDTVSIKIKDIDKQIDSLNTELWRECKCQHGTRENDAVADTALR